jgi:hypothetical protein
LRNEFLGEYDFEKLQIETVVTKSKIPEADFQKTFEEKSELPDLSKIANSRGRQRDDPQD